MTGLTLEPYALQQRWAADRPLDPEAWAALLGEYLTGLAGMCAKSGPCVIGHIKLLALFDGQAYIQVSVVSPTHPPTIAGAVPSSLAEIASTLNVLVYGLPREQLAALTSVQASETATRWAVTVTEYPHTARIEHAH